MSTRDLKRRLERLERLAGIHQEPTPIRHLVDDRFPPGWMALGVAAQVLGMTENALRLHVTRGNLETEDWSARKVGNRWQIKPYRHEGNATPRKAIDDFTRGVVYGKTGGKCWHCQIDILPGAFDVDHLIPLAAGGSNDIGNLVPSCVSCNRRKGSKVM